MVRTSFAVLAGSIVAFLVAIIAFIGGWTTARAMNHITLRTFVTATVAEQSGEGATPAELNDSFAVFWEVWDLVHHEFYHTEPLDQREMVYGAIRGMLQSLDDEYTIFQEPEDAERSRESMQGHFEGIGVYMGMADGKITVDRPIRGAPAMEAGLQNGDVIVAVDGAELHPLIEGMAEGEAMDEAARRIRGPKGSPVTLTIYRPASGETFDVEIVRDEVPLISVNGQMLNNDIAYIQITEFKATTTEEFDETLRELLPRQPSALVLDLRNNPGGFLNTAQEVLGRFYDGPALYERWSDGSMEELRTMRGADDVRIPDMPVVVLVNGRSASASEIVAGALRDERPDTLLLGEQSFGKGSVQNIHRLSDGSSTRITIAHWFTPDQHEIHEVGIAPDHVVLPAHEPQYAVPCTEGMQPLEGQEMCSDAQLSWALRVLTSDETPPPAEEPQAQQE
jgi:carboxyl-terminal processing protease